MFLTDVPVVVVDGGVPSAVVVLDLSWWRWWQHGGAAITVLVLDLLLPPRDPPERIWCWICLLPELLLPPLDATPTRCCCSLQVMLLSSYATPIPCLELGVCLLFIKK